MTTSTTAKSPAEKLSEKILEKRRALGRGLESLLPGPRVVAPVPTDSSPLPGVRSEENRLEQAGPAVATQVVDLRAVAGEHMAEGDRAVELPLDWIQRNPHQTRLEFDPKALSDLTGSIQAQGVLQPIVVRPMPLPTGDQQRFLLILGERRYRASKMAGKKTIPAIIKRVSEQQAAEMTLVENLQRQDLDCLEQAAAFAHLSTDFNLTQEQIGKRVGVSREQVSNYLRLLRLPESVLQHLRKKELTFSHARLLLSLGDDEKIAKLAHHVVEKKMSVSALEDKILDAGISHDHQEAPKQGTARWVDPNVRAAQRQLETVLGMRVRIRDRSGKGKITIEYGTLEDFDRVVGMLQGAKVRD